jgi:hypothetical protein
MNFFKTLMQAYMQDRSSAKIQDNVSDTAQYLPFHVMYETRNLQVLTFVI